MALAGRASRPIRPASGRGRPSLWLAALLIGFAALVAFRFALTSAAFRNADDAGNFLAGVDMAEGNWRLHGWVMAPDNYVPTDVLGQAILKLLFGFHPIFMQAWEALVWAAVGALGAALAGVGAPRRHLPGTLCLALSLLAFNIFGHEFRDVFLSSIASHGFTILLTLGTFGLVATWDGLWRPRSAALRAALLGGVMTVGAFADPIFVVVACLPVLAVALLGIRLDGSGSRPEIQIGVAVGAVLLARALLALNAQTGGFTSIRLSIPLASFEDLSSHLGFAVQSIARLLGAEFFGRSFDQPLTAGPLIYLLRAPLVIGLAIVCWAVGGQVFRRVVAWPNGRPAQGGEDLDHLLWFNLVCCVASASITTVIVDQSCARFFYPAAVAGSILVARRFGRMPLGALYGGATMLASIVFGIAALPPGSPRDNATIPQVGQIIGALRQHGLRHGYAGYWESTIVTAIADRKITSLPIAPGPDGRLHAFQWLCNLDWFRSAAADWHDRIFVIAASRPGGLELSEDAIIRQFGRPAERIDLGQFIIDVYDPSGRPPNLLD